MSDSAREPDPLEKTAVDLTPNLPPALPPPLPSRVPPSLPASVLDVTMPDLGAASPSAMAVTPPTVPPPGSVGNPADFATLPVTAAVGAFTTTLAATMKSKMSVTIPEPFLAAGTPGSLLRLVPVEMLRGRPPLEVYLKSGATFTLGRSPEADWITAFFPRSEKNDLRSKRLSKLHAWLEYRDGQLWAHCARGHTIHIGAREIGSDPAGASLRERDKLLLAEDYALEVYYDISLQGSLQFTNGEAWLAGRIDFAPACSARCALNRSTVRWGYARVAGFSSMSASAAHGAVFSRQDRSSRRNRACS